MTRKQRFLLIRIVLSLLLFVFSALFPLNLVFKFIILVSSYLIIGYTVLLKALKNIINGQVFDENFLMVIATVGAFIIREYNEAVFVMLFYQVGELFESLAVGKSRKSISELMDLRPDYANVVRENEILIVSPEEVTVGETILVKAGERIPLDGTVIRGFSSLNMSSLTGEPVPREVEPGDEVISGAININGALEIRAEKVYSESTAARILELAENVSANKSKAENFITSFAKYYTPAVVILALIIGIVPPIFFGGWSVWIYRALSFLVISCPCALVISVPLTYFAGIGSASKSGILVKGGAYLEKLSNVDTVVFDKTGTLTEGSFRVKKIHSDLISKDELLELAAHVEAYSNHPISLSLRDAYSKEIDRERISGVNETPGKGISAVIDGRTIYVGNIKLMNEIGSAVNNVSEIGTVIHIAETKNDFVTYLGYILISDSIKSSTKEAISNLKKLCIKKTVILTGDSKKGAEAVGKELAIDEIYCELLPSNKVETVEKLLKDKKRKSSLVFVGDGINDAPVLSVADVGVAMGAIGSDAAIESADIVIMNDDLLKLSEAIKISRKTHRIVRQNIVMSLIIKLAVLILSAFGVLGMIFAVFADVGVMVLAVLNAIRAISFK